MINKYDIHEGTDKVYTCTARGKFSSLKNESLKEWICVFYGF